MKFSRAVEETLARLNLVAPAAKTIGILATSGTLKSQLFQRGLEKAGLRPLLRA